MISQWCIEITKGPGLTVWKSISKPRLKPLAQASQIPEPGQKPSQAVSRAWPGLAFQWPAWPGFWLCWARAITSLIQICKHTCCNESIRALSFWNSCVICFFTCTLCLFKSWISSWILWYWSWTQECMKSGGGTKMKAMGCLGPERFPQLLSSYHL